MTDERAADVTSALLARLADGAVRAAASSFVSWRSQSAFAIQLGVSFPRLNEVSHAKRSVTPDSALRLAQLTRMSADFWLGLQQDWDDDHI